MQKREKNSRTLLEKKLKEGRGTGHGAEYKPWIRIGEFQNKGESFGMPSLEFDRQYQLLSELEQCMHMLAEYSQEVTTIREQYPLLPLEATLSFAESVGLTHPYAHNFPVVLTVDTLLTVETSDTSQLCAVSVKWTSDLADPRVAEKLALERAYCLSLNYNWRLVTEKELTDQLRRNLLFLREWAGGGLIGREPPGDQEVDRYLDAFFLADLSRPIGEITDALAGQLCIKPGRAMFLFKYLAWHHKIKVDILSVLEANKPHLALKVNRRPS